jgi:hypothetical protein
MTSVGEKIAFLHVPKTGGVWAVEAMKAAGVELEQVGKHTQLKDLDRYPGRFRIAFVREPLSWCRSWWVHRQTQGDWIENSIPDNVALAVEPNFEAFLEGLIAKYPGYVSALFEQFTGPADDAIEFVGLHERLVDDLVAGLKLAGQEFDEGKLRSFPAKNVGPTDVSTDCSPALEELLRWTERRTYRRFYREYPLPGSRPTFPPPGR